MLRPERVLQIVLLPTTTLCVFARAQEFTHNAPAAAANSATTLQQSSGFHQGFMRGYEQGFHNADQDFHVGRTDRKLDTFREYRKASEGYCESFGGRESFKQGYRLGFAQGYDDSFHSRHFSAAVAEQAAQKVRSKK